VQICLVVAAIPAHPDEDEAAVTSDLVFLHAAPSYRVIVA